MRQKDELAVKYKSKKLLLLVSSNIFGLHILSSKTSA